ncbi:hypothetical protein LCGC14_0534220 [marine sediment metagenome]|uniref:Uncharacterized protein n=1 Tax=marine sediment metagenome TaxID=412755 RepID=A0A0F9V2U8_9ZZZZ
MRVNLFRYLYYQLRLALSQKARDEMESVQATYEYTKELLFREKAKCRLQERNLLDKTQFQEVVVYDNEDTKLKIKEGSGMDVVEYDPDALDILIQREAAELHEMLKKEGWA